MMNRIVPRRVRYCNALILGVSSATCQLTALLWSQTISVSQCGHNSQRFSGKALLQHACQGKAKPHQWIFGTGESQNLVPN